MTKKSLLNVIKEKEEEIGKLNLRIKVLETMYDDLMTRYMQEAKKNNPEV